MEAAASMKDFLKDNSNVVVVGITEPYEGVLGKEVGSAMKSLSEEKGIKFITGKSFKQINSTDGKASSLQFSDGTTIPCDMIVMGTGCKPNTKLAVDSDIKIEKSGHITCDVFMKTSDANIFAAGDICSVPWFYNAQRISCEHYGNSITQGSIAAWNMLGRQVPYDTVPTVWTKIWGTNMHYSGHATSWDNVVIDGDIKERKFLAYYIKDGRVDAVSGMGRAGDVLLLNQAMKLNIVPLQSEFKNGMIDLVDLRQRVAELKTSCMCNRENITNCSGPYK